MWSDNYRITLHASAIAVRTQGRNCVSDRDALSLSLDATYFTLANWDNTMIGMRAQSSLTTKRPQVRVDHALFGRDVTFRIVFLLTLFNGAFFIWKFRFLPISDYPDWVFEGNIIARIIQHLPAPLYSIKHYPVPYSVVPGLLGLLDLFLAPEVSGKIVLSLTIVLFAVSSLYLIASQGRDETRPAIYVPLLFLFNSFFFWGELSYLAGLIVVFFYTGYLLRHLGESSRISYYAICIYITLAFFCHFIDFTIACLLTTLLFAFCPKTLSFKRIALAMAPSLILSCWYAAERIRVEHRTGPIWQPWTIHTMIGRLLGAFSPFPEFLPWLGIAVKGMGIAAVVDLLTCLAMLLLVFVTAAVWIRRRVNTPLFACSIACFAAFLATGYSFEGMISPGERFLYPSVWLALCWWMAFRPEPRFVAGFMKGVLILAIVAQTLFLDIYIGMTSTRLANLDTAFRSAKSHSEFCSIYKKYVSESWEKPNRVGLDRLLTNHSSVPRLPYYDYIESGEAAPIFQVGILRFSGPGDNEDLCK
jgi:hypothetical protein